MKAKLENGNPKDPPYKKRAVKGLITAGPALHLM